MSYLRNRRVEVLLKKLYRNPYNFSDKDIEKLINLHVRPSDMKDLLHKLYNMNDGVIINKSYADQGIMGWVNKKCRASKNRKFWKKIKDDKKREGLERIILAEGDSWFEFPIFIKEIVDQLISRNKKKYAVYSLAYAGDWISNMLYNREYVDKLSLIRPEIFLISGGGNDILGSYRLANLIIPRKELPVNIYYQSEDFAKKCFNKNYYRLMKIIEFNYMFLFTGLKLRSTKFEDMRIITHGYDYAKPDARRGINPLFHKIKNGQWLTYPFLLRGYTDRKEMDLIVKFMIDDLNEMLIRTGGEFDNIYHIDIRGTAKEKKDWHNEIHPKSKKFEEIAETYEDCINKPLDKPPKDRVFECSKT